MAEMVSYGGIEGPVQAYLSRPEGYDPRPAVVVIHEIYGLSAHMKNVADRIAREGYVALAPHLFSRPGLGDVLTPERIGATLQVSSSWQRERFREPDYLQEQLGKLLPQVRERIEPVVKLMYAGGMPRSSLTEDLVRAVEYLNGQEYVQSGRIASLGFCFGGGMSLSLACTTPLAACVVFYGENPTPVERVQSIAGPVLGLYGGEDLRISSRLDELVRAMVTYKKDFEMKLYPGAPHAFFNDTTANYREIDAKEAWGRVQRFLQRTLL